MPSIPSVLIVVSDNGASAALSVPQTSIQLVIGSAVGGTPNQPFASSNPQSIQTQFVGGPLVEAAGLVAAAGNIALCISCPIVTLGTANAVTATVPGGSTSTVTVSLDATNGAWDTYFVWMKCLVGGTIGTAPGPTVQFSGDAGRNWGTPISLGTATTFTLGNGAITSPVVGGTGIKMNFGAGSMVAGDYWKFGTTAPIWNDAGLSAALSAFYASQYGVAGVGSVHIVGPVLAADISAIHTSLQNATSSSFIFNRAICELPDTLQPTAWGGTGETEATWMARIEGYVAGEAAQARVCADGGYYNMTSAFANQSFGLPAYRRSLAWAHAARRTQVPLQRRAGRVKDGPYSNIVVNPATDPTDGFVYHDERVTPGLNAARIGSAMTWPKKGQGFFQCQEPLLSAPGSQFTEVAIGNVLDAACDIAYATGVEEVSDDLKTQTNGTLDPVNLNELQGEIQQAMNQGLVQTPLVSDVTATVSPTQNVLATGVVAITVVVTPRAYVNQMSETINLNTGT